MQVKEVELLPVDTTLLTKLVIFFYTGNIAQSIPEENYLSYSVLNYLKKLKAQAKTEYDRTCNEVAIKVKASETKRVVTSFKNPFDIPRHQLLDQVARLRTLFLRPSQTSALQHGKHAILSLSVNRRNHLWSTSMFVWMILFLYILHLQYSFFSVCT